MLIHNANFLVHVNNPFRKYSSIHTLAGFKKYLFFLFR
jgi:hypothetical protein